VVLAPRLASKNRRSVSIQGLCPYLIHPSSPTVDSMRLLSLTRELRDPTSPITHFLRTTFRCTERVERSFERQLRGAPTLRPIEADRDYPYALVGGAIDYRIKYYFGIPPWILVPAARSSIWWHGGIYGSDAGTALDDRVPFPIYGPGNSLHHIPRVTAELFMSLQEFLTRVAPVHQRLSLDDEAWLCRYCYGLALVDRKMTAAHANEPYELKKLQPGATLADLWDLAPRRPVGDVRQLSYLFHDHHRVLFEQQVNIAPQCVWNQRIGATADLQVEHMLIDMKTTILSRLDLRWLYQVLAYVLLDVHDALKIERVGFSMVRQGVFATWDVDHLIQVITGSSTCTRERLRSTLLSAIWASHTRSDQRRPTASRDTCLTSP